MNDQPQDNQQQSEMPRYRSHKEVWALKIHEIRSPRSFEDDGNDSMFIVPAEKEFAEVRVDAAYVAKHNPQVGGYYVVYKDGYKSWSPAEAFEEGYTRVN